MPLSANESAIARVVTTPARGKPFPKGLPNVTISGTTPCVWKPQKWVPTLPNPTCTSSAMQTPPERYKIWEMHYPCRTFCYLLFSPPQTLYSSSRQGTLSVLHSSSLILLWRQQVVFLLNGYRVFSVSPAWRISLPQQGHLCETPLDRYLVLVPTKDYVSFSLGGLLSTTLCAKLGGSNPPRPSSL